MPTDMRDAITTPAQVREAVGDLATRFHPLAELARIVDRVCDSGPESEWDLMDQMDQLTAHAVLLFEQDLGVIADKIAAWSYEQEKD